MVRDFPQRPMDVPPAAAQELVRRLSPSEAENHPQITRIPQMKKEEKKNRESRRKTGSHAFWGRRRVILSSSVIRRLIGNLARRRVAACGASRVRRASVARAENHPQ